MVGTVLDFEFKKKISCTTAKANAYESRIYPILYFLANISNVSSSCYVLVSHVKWNRSKGRPRSEAMN